MAVRHANHYTKQVVTTGGMGDGIWVIESSGYLFLDQGDWIPMGDEGFGEVGDVGVEVIRMAAYAPLPSDNGVGDLAFGSYGVSTVIMEILLVVGGFNMDRDVEVSLAIVNIDV